MTLGDRLIVMDNGYAAQIGTPLDIYEKPATRFVAGFIGSPAMNFLDGHISPDGRSVQLNGEVNFPLENGSVRESGGKDVTLGIRPEHFKLTEEKKGKMQLKVDHVEQLGADTLVHGRFGEEKFFFNCAPYRYSALQEKHRVIPDCSPWKAAFI